MEHDYAVKESYRHEMAVPFDVVVAGIRIHGTAAIGYDCQSEGASFDHPGGFEIEANAVLAVTVIEPAGLSIDRLTALRAHLEDDPAAEEAILDHIAGNHQDDSHYDDASYHYD